ncbi:MAG: protein kinase [Lachnospiraceae bacterium]|nr:protein kinase [Lachnospiraceae bacterium]
MPYPGEVLAGAYQIVDEIGAGGAGIIYRAWHRNLQKYVVVKKIKENFGGALNARGEVDILKSLHHTCLPQVYDFVQIGSEIYTVMDYIEGHDLKYYIDRQCAFTEEQLWFWLSQLLDVLSYLHSRGILHLDIKPANIMLTPEGNVCLIDFNISFGGEGEMMQGISRIYASPEQYRKWMGILYHTADAGLTLDAQTDIYSLGGVFYQMMTGYPPSPEPQNMYALSAFRLPFSDTLIRIVSRMMEPEKKKRYAGVDRIQAAIRRSQRTRAEKRTLRTVFGLLTAGIAILVIVVGVVVWRGQGAVSSSDRASIAEEEERLAELNAEGEYEEAYQEGTQYLNINADMLVKVDGARQSILEQVLDACMGMEEYSRAEAYVEELLEIETLADYEATAAVICAYNGDYEAAEEYIAAAEEDGADTDKLSRTSAEIAAAQGEYEEAVAIYREIYEESGGTDILRRLAALTLKAGLEEASGSVKSSGWLAQAIAYYEQLCADDMGSYTEQMNLATAYMAAGYDNRASTLLKSMSVQYPDQYKVFLKLAVLDYNAQMKKAVADRDFSSVLSNTKKAKELYDAETDAAEDEELQTMVQIAEDLS